MLDSDLTDKAPEISLIPANYKRNFQGKGFLWRNSISVQENQGKGLYAGRAFNCSCNHCSSRGYLHSHFHLSAPQGQSRH